MTSERKVLADKLQSEGETEAQNIRSDAERRAAELMDAALAMAQRIVANPPLGVRTTKEAVVRSLEMPFTEGMRLATLLFRSNHGTEDAKEAHRARTEKRKPVFKGK